jgi:diaminopimelate decarboxylase
MEEFDKAQLTYTHKGLNLSLKPIKDIIEEHPTPFYLYSQKILEKNYKDFYNAAIANDMQTTVCFAVKSNNNKHVLKALAKLGAGADIVSGGELKAALKAGIPAEKIVFSGVGKTKDEIKLGLKHDIKSFNVESIEELELINKLAQKMETKANVAFRLNPKVHAKTHKHISTGYKTHKFGILAEDIVQTAQDKKYWTHTNLVGISVHIGSQLTELDATKEAIINACKCANDLPHKLQFIDVGGGLGVNYHPTNTKAPKVHEYMQLVAEALSTYQHKVEVVFEPGRRIAASSGFFVTSVIRSKMSEDCRFLIVDGGMNDFVRPSLYDAYHEVLAGHDSGELIETDIVGPICETADCFATKRKLPLLKYKDFIVIADTGAYGHTMSSTYNMRKQASELFLTTRGKLKS